MQEEYWALFRATGMPEFYLLYRSYTHERAEAKTAWSPPQAKWV